MTFPPEIPPAVMAHLDVLRARGGRVLLVGGAVRESLLGRVVYDFDVATDLRPAALADLFGSVVDAKLGAVHLAAQGFELTVTSLRRESDYRDQRHPSQVEFVDTPAEDARRRDFTINAIYGDPWSGELVDPLGGVADLRAGVLRVIGDPAMRLREDPLRLLRAVRFAAACGCQLAPATAAAIQQHAAEVTTLAQERVFEELTRAFTGAGRGRALALLVDTGLAAHVLPEVVDMPGVEQPPEYHPEGDVFVHVCLVLDKVLPDDPVQAWAAVLHDAGKPATFERAADRIRFSGHDTRSAELADAALRRFRAPRELRETVVEIARDHIRFAALPSMKPAKRERWLRSPRFWAHLEFHRADCLGSHGKLGIYEFATAALAVLPPTPPPPLCTGRDVLDLGIPEGPLVGAILRQIDEELVDQEVSDRDAALLRLRTLVEDRFSDLR